MLCFISFILIHTFHFSVFWMFLFNTLFFPSFGSTLTPTHTPFNFSFEILHPTFLATLKILICPINLKSNVNGIFIFLLNNKGKLKMPWGKHSLYSTYPGSSRYEFYLNFFNHKLNYITNIFYRQYLLSFTHSPHGCLFGIPSMS